MTTNRARILNGIRAASVVGLLATAGVSHAAVTDMHLAQVAPMALRHRLRRNPLDNSGSTARIERAVGELFAA